MKIGAFTSCSGCGFTPEQVEDQAKSVLLSDQAANPSALAEAVAQLQAGRAVVFDPEAVASWVAAIQANSLRMPIGCALLWYAPLVIMVLLAIAVVALFVYLKWWAA